MFATAALLVLTAMPQQPQRLNGLGRVTDRDGAPWGGAEVHLLHRAHVDVADPEFADEITVTADAEGEFRVELLAGANYTAWAIGAGSTAATRRATRVATDAVARTPILLVEGPEVHVRRFRPRLDASWNDREQLRWRAVGRVGRMTLSAWLRADADGVFELPTWPAEYIGAQAWTADWLAFRCNLATSRSMALRFGPLVRRGDPLPAADDVDRVLTAVADIEVPIRRERAVLLRDDTGTPVPDVEVRADAAPFDVAPQRTGADGKVHAVFAAADPEPSQVPFRWCLLPPNAAEGSLSPSSSRDTDPPVVQRDLAPGATVHGRLLWQKDDPAAGVPLALEASIGTGAGAFMFGVGPRIFRTAADGSFALPGRCAEFPYRLVAVLSPAMCAQLGRAADGWPVAENVVLRWRAAGKPQDFGDLDLARMPRVDITVRAPDGTPPGATRLLLAHVKFGEHDPSYALVANTDHRGRLRVLVHDPEDVVVLADAAGGAAWARLAAEQREVALQLDPRHVMPFRVVDRQGQPIAKAHVHLVTVRTVGAAESDVVRTVADLCMVQSFPRAVTDVDADGRGSIVVPVLGVGLDLSITRDDGLDERTGALWTGNSTEPAEVALRR